MRRRQRGGLHWAISALVSLVVVLAFTVLIAITSAVLVTRGVAFLERYTPHVGVPEEADRPRVTARER